MKTLTLKNSLLLVAVLFASGLFAQDWVQMMQDPNSNFYDVQKAFHKYYRTQEQKMERERKSEKNSGKFLNKEESEVGGYQIYKRWEAYMLPRIGPNGELPAPDATWKAMEEYNSTHSSSMAAGNWSLIGPTNTSSLPGAGRLNFIEINPGDPNKLYVGSPDGGLWMSTNGGSSWTTNTDKIAQTIGFSDLAFDPNNSNIMYAVTGDRDGGRTISVGLLKSTDGGATWQKTGLSYFLHNYVYLHRVIVDPTNSNTIYVSANTGVYKSTNAGVTFNIVESTGGYTTMELKPGTPSTIYAGGTTFKYSTNGGTSWNTATGLPAQADMYRMKMAVSAASPSVVYLLPCKTQANNFAIDGFYKSTNSGASFTKISTPANMGDQGFYDLCVAANPTNANEVIIGGQTVCYKSTNGGTSWTQTASGTHVDYHHIKYQSNGTTVYLTSDGGIYKSTNGGSTWSDISNNLAIGEMYGFGHSATDANLTIQGWQDNGTNVYDGTWNNAHGGDGMMAFISHSNDQHMWLEEYAGKMFADLGSGLINATSGITEGVGDVDVAPWNVQWMEDPNTPDKLYAGFQNVWVSTNGGQSWTKPGNVAGTSTVTINALTVSPANSKNIWCAKGGDLYKSTNSGASWTAITSLPVGGFVSAILCHPTDENKVWVAFTGFLSQNKVFVSTNQGSSWTNISGSLPNIPMTCLAIDKNGNDAVYLGSDAGVFFRDASMNVWQPFTNGLPNVRVTQMRIFYGSNPAKIRASTFGRSLWESTVYQPGTYNPAANFIASQNVTCAGAAVQFSDYSLGEPTSWSWTFTGGNPSSSTVKNPLVIYNTPGTYPVTLTATNGNGSDTKTVNSFITIGTSPKAAPTANSFSFCGPKAVTFTATPSFPGTVRWWDAPGGGSIVGTGNTYTTPVLSTSATYYVDETFPNLATTDVVGAPDYTIGAGNMFTASDIRGLWFDVLQPVVINSVDVFANTAGVRTIEIVDSQGNWVTDTTLNIAASTPTTTPTTVTINRTLQPGTGYMMKFRGTVDCFRNNAGAVYPYTSSAVNITGSNANGAPGYYYFFYNWQITAIVCNTPRTAVTATETCLTSINNVVVDGSLNIFPNPTNGPFTLNFQTVNADNYTVKITNAIGETVYNEVLTNFNGDYSKKIDVSSYGAGIYMLNISNSKNESVKKVIVH